MHKSKTPDSPSAEIKKFIYKKKNLNIALRLAKAVKKMQSRELSRDVPSPLEEWSLFLCQKHTACFQSKRKEKQKPNAVPRSRCPCARRFPEGTFPTNSRKSARQHHGESRFPSSLLIAFKCFVFCSFFSKVLSVSSFERYSRTLYISYKVKTFVTTRNIQKCGTWGGKKAHPEGTEGAGGRPLSLPGGGCAWGQK